MQSETFRFAGGGAASLSCRQWRPASEPRTIALLVHGYAEHGGRYAHVAERLVAAGHAVYALDLRGHGLSPGVRADVRRFEDYLSDVEGLLAVVRERHPGRPVVLVGHSMGGAIAILFASRRGGELAALVTSGAGVKLGGRVPPLLVFVVRALALLAPRLPLTPIDVEAVSRDAAVVARYRVDPLNYHGRIRARMGRELVRATELIAAELHRIALPALILHGGGDRLADPEGSRMLHEGIVSTDRRLVVYDGLYHEIFNEPEREQVLDDLVGWLGERFA
jgi:alpha-beta hydrolase superfamily lysophospholipase